jgi:hypothetical protein
MICSWWIYSCKFNIIFEASSTWRRSSILDGWTKLRHETNNLIAERSARKTCKTQLRSSTNAAFFLPQRTETNTTRPMDVDEKSPVRCARPVSTINDRAVTRSEAPTSQPSPFQIQNRTVMLREGTPQEHTQQAAGDSSSRESGRKASNTL